MTTPLKAMHSYLCTAEVRCDVVSISSISVCYVQLIKHNCVCMLGSCECCPVCVGIPELYV